MLTTNNPCADYERHADHADAVASAIEQADDSTYDRALQEVRGAILAADAGAIVTHVSIAGRRIGVLIAEPLTDHMHDQNGALLQLLSCAALGDIVGAAQAAETIISAVAHRHAEDVTDRLEIAGEVMA